MSTPRPYHHHKIDPQALRDTVPTVQSWRALALAMNLPYPSSYVYEYVRPMCGQHGIDYSHFTGQATNRGKTFPGKRTDIQLYLDNELPINSHNLKLRLIQEGLKEHTCERCKRTEWEGRLIPIQLHHIDGNSSNNTLTNLQIICPNCHAQTPNFCGKNVAKKDGDRHVVGPLVSDERFLKIIPLSHNIAQVLREAGLSLAKAHYNRVNRLLSDHPEVKLLPKTRSI